MKHLLELAQEIAPRVKPPLLIIMGSPWPATQLVSQFPNMDATCFQMDLFQADRLREKLEQENLTAEVVTGADVWDLPQRFQTVLFPAAAKSDFHLKLDMLEQGYHVLEEGGMFITLSEYSRDLQFAKWHKKVFGKCGETPRSKIGMAFWSERHGNQPRRRHAIDFHAKIGDGQSMAFASWPGTFSYGRMDKGARAMLEVAEVKPGDHVLDMGCGNGAVGCLASDWVGPNGKVTFVDSNLRAMALTQYNAESNGVINANYIATSKMEGILTNSIDVALANPPYYANSDVAQMFIARAREMLKPGGQFYLVTKMPVQTIPEVVDVFDGEVETIENRGYTILIARA